jgi:hypothetical protein
MTTGKLIGKILWRKKSRWELNLAASGFLLGLGLFLVSMQVYFDVDTILNLRLAQGKKADYIVLSKKIGAIKTNETGGPGFSPEEIARLSGEKFTLDTGEVLANEFEAQASIDIFGQGFMTELFFEAVPDRFLDVVPAEWKSSKPGDPVPVIVSRDFLLLYNFGFAQSRRMPLLTEDLIKLVPVSLTISGRGRHSETVARIVGLSDRIASILIPYDTLKKFNNEFGSGKKKRPMRLIISVKDRSDPGIVKYIDDNFYETSKEKLRLSDVGFTVKTVVSVVALVGVFLIFLSFTVFVTSFRLIILRSSPEVRLLLDLGYTKGLLIGNILMRLSILLGFVTVASSVIVFSAVYALRSFLTSNGFTGFPFFVHPVIPVSGFVIVILVFALNYISLKTTMRKNDRD